MCWQQKTLLSKRRNLMKYQGLFEPINIGKLEIKNRYAMAPMGPLCSANNNTCNMMPKVLI